LRFSTRLRRTQQRVAARVQRGRAGGFGRPGPSVGLPGAPGLAFPRNQPNGGFGTGKGSARPYSKGAWSSPTGTQSSSRNRCSPGDPGSASFHGLGDGPARNGRIPGRPGPAPKQKTVGPCRSSTLSGPTRAHFWDGSGKPRPGSNPALSDGHRFRARQGTERNSGRTARPLFRKARNGPPDPGFSPVQAAGGRAPSGGHRGAGNASPLFCRRGGQATPFPVTSRDSRRAQTPPLGADQVITDGGFQHG